MAGSGNICIPAISYCMTCDTDLTQGMGFWSYKELELQNTEQSCCFQEPCAPSQIYNPLFLLVLEIQRKKYI
jgi:hypothetical protein